MSRNELGSADSWSKRGKVFQTKTFAALKMLYGTPISANPWPEPKGIQTKEGKNASITSSDVYTEAKA